MLEKISADIRRRYRETPRIGAAGAEKSAVGVSWDFYFNVWELEKCTIISLAR